MLRLSLVALVACAACGSSDDNIADAPVQVDSNGHDGSPGADAGPDGPAPAWCPLSCAAGSYTLLLVQSNCFQNYSCFGSVNAYIAADGAFEFKSPYFGSVNPQTCSGSGSDPDVSTSITYQVQIDTSGTTVSVQANSTGCYPCTYRGTPDSLLDMSACCAAYPQYPGCGPDGGALASP